MSNFFTFKDKVLSFLRSGIYDKFHCGGCNATYYSKIKVILKSECVNTREFLQSLGNKLKVMMVLPLKNIFYSVFTHLILKICQFSLPTTTTL